MIKSHIYRKWDNRRIKGYFVCAALFGVAVFAAMGVAKPRHLITI